MLKLSKISQNKLEQNQQITFNIKMPNSNGQLPKFTKYKKENKNEYIRSCPNTRSQWMVKVRSLPPPKKNSDHVCSHCEWGFWLATLLQHTLQKNICLKKFSKSSMENPPIRDLRPVLDWSCIANPWSAPFGQTGPKNTGKITVEFAKGGSLGCLH